MDKHGYAADQSDNGRYVLKYFMWGYQQHARAAMSVSAERLFAALASGLSPAVHLVGFLDEERQGRHPICVEPEDEGFAPEQFTGVKALAKTLQTVGTGMMWIHPSEAVAERFEERDRRSYLKKALASILEQTGARSEAITFCGWPEKVDGFLVIPVLQLNKVVFESLPRLPLDH